MGIIGEVGTVGLTMASPRSTAPDRSPRSWWRPALILGVTVLVLAGALYLVRDRLPSWSQVAQALAGADPWWMLAAVLLTVGQIALVARQQRLLLAAFGVPISWSRMQGITYAAAGISSVMPAGGAVAGGYTFREFRRVGAPSGVAGTVMVLSGVLAAVGLGLAALLVPVVTWAAGTGSAAAAWLALLLVLSFVAWIGASHWTGRTEPIDAPTPRLDAWAADRPRLAAAARAVVHAGRRTASLTGVELRSVLVPSTVKWLLDAAALWASCLALGLDPDPLAIGVMFVGVQVVRQIPLTPGGTGLVEAALLAGLTATGAPAAQAAGAVLVYRLISTWAVAAVGGLAAVALVRSPDLETVDSGGFSTPPLVVLEGVAVTGVAADRMAADVVTADVVTADVGTVDVGTGEAVATDVLVADVVVADTIPSSARSAG